MPEVIMPKMGDAMEEGTLLKWLKSEGDDVSEGDAIAEIETDKVTLELEAEDSGTLAQATATETEEGTEDGGAQQAAAPSGNGAGGNGQFRASPIVRRLARENDLDLSKIDGSGPAGRIVERDVKAAMERGDAKADGGAADGQADGQADVAAPEQPSAGQAQMQGFQPARLPEPTGAPGTQLVEPTRMMKVIGERMTEAKQHVPHFYATVEVRMDAAL